MCFPKKQATTITSVALLFQGGLATQLARNFGIINANLAVDYTSAEAGDLFCSDVQWEARQTLGARFHLRVLGAFLDSGGLRYVVCVRLTEYASQFLNSGEVMERGKTLVSKPPSKGPLLWIEPAHPDTPIAYGRCPDFYF